MYGLDGGWLFVHWTRASDICFELWYLSGSFMYSGRASDALIKQSGFEHWKARLVYLFPLSLYPQELHSKDVTGNTILSSTLTMWKKAGSGADNGRDHYRYKRSPFGHVHLQKAVTKFQSKYCIHITCIWFRRMLAPNKPSNLLTDKPLVQLRRWPAKGKRQ